MKNTWLLHDNFEGIPDDARDILNSYEEIEDSSEECAQELTDLGYKCEIDFGEIVEVSKNEMHVDLVDCDWSHKDKE